ncbi:hypothetical protein QJQ45_018009, partial [Haematococcus lacustris]
ALRQSLAADDELGGRLDATLQQVAALQALEGQRAAELEEAKEVYTILSREVERLRAELVRAKDEAGPVQRLAAELSSLRGELGRQHSALDAALDARDLAEAELGSARDIIAGLHSEVDALRANLQEASIAVESATAAVEASVAAAVAAQQRGGPNNEATAAAALAATSALERASAATANVSNAQAAQIKALREKDEESQALIAALRAELESEARATAALLQRAETLVRANEGEGAASAADHLQRLQAQLEERSAAAEEASARAASLEADTARLRAELRGAREQLAAYEATSAASPASSPSASRRASGREPGPSQADLEAAKQGAAAARAEAAALRNKVSGLEAELAGRDKQVALLLEATRGGRGSSGNTQLAALSEQIAELTAQNTAMKASASRREQLLLQTRTFLQDKAAAAAAAAASASPSPAGLLGPGAAQYLTPLAGRQRGTNQRGAKGGGGGQLLERSRGHLKRVEEGWVEMIQYAPVLVKLTSEDSSGREQTFKQADLTVYSKSVPLVEQEDVSDSAGCRQSQQLTPDGNLQLMPVNSPPRGDIATAVIGSKGLRQLRVTVKPEQALLCPEDEYQDDMWMKRWWCVVV